MSKGCSLQVIRFQSFWYKLLSCEGIGGSIFACRARVFHGTEDNVRAIPTAAGAGEPAAGLAKLAMVRGQPSCARHGRIRDPSPNTRPHMSNAGLIYLIHPQGCAVYCAEDRKSYGEEVQSWR